MCRSVLTLLYMAVLSLGGVPPAVNALQGMGSTLPDTVFQDAFFAYRFVNSNITVTYSGTTTKQGLCRLEAYTTACAPEDVALPLAVDFAASPTPLPAVAYDQYPDLQMYPVVACAVVPVYNLGGITTLAFSTATLALIYSGTITDWGDSRIAADNPGLALPSHRIVVVVRADTAAETQVWKQALAHFDPSFNIPIDQTARWPNVTVTKQSGSLGLNAFVMLTPFTIGYSELGGAQNSNLAIAAIRRGASIVQASTAAIEYAVMELGGAFGNNGDDAAHLTADISGTTGILSWPICSYIYLVIRKNTLRTGATCDDRLQLVAFLQWFLTSTVVQNLTQKNAYGTIPAVVLDTVLGRLTNDVMCNGTVVHVNNSTIRIFGVGVASVASLFNVVQSMYELVDPTVSVGFTDATESAIAALGDPLTANAFVVSGRPYGFNPNAVAVPFVAVSVAFLSAYSLVLDLSTLVGILNGAITLWGDSALAAINPAGILDASGHPVDPTQPIALLKGPSAVDILTSALQGAGVQCACGALANATLYQTDDVLQTAVVGAPYSLGIAVLRNSINTVALVAQFKTAGGAVITPSWQAVQACMLAGNYDPIMLSFTAGPQDTNSSCYPLFLPLYVTVQKSLCNVLTDPLRTSSIDFVEWLFGGTTLDAGLQEQNLVPLHAIPAVAPSVAATLNTITCNPRTTTNSSMMFIIVGTLVALFAVALAVGGLWAWRSSRQMRTMRKQFSNDNVAQECAAAIASFDLEKVAWLNTLPNPNRIQQSFIKIVRLLTDVKPFIPDQLLMSLVSPSESPFAADPAGPGDKRYKAPGWDTDDGHTSLDKRRRATRSDQSLNSGSTSGSDTATAAMHHNKTVPSRPGPPRNPIGPPIATIAPASSDGERQQLWSRRRCTYLFLRLIPVGSLEDLTVLTDLAEAISAVVGCCKRHGATIDRVSYDAVGVHWGVSTVAAQGALKAVTTALELGALAARGWHGRVSLQSGVGVGMCHVAALSASGHRFFVVCGPEVAIPVDTVTSGGPAQCHCTVLMSTACYHEVQYAIRSAPRKLFRDVLLWEPLELMDGDAAGADEWMYSLKKLNQEDEATSPIHRLVAVFQLARTGNVLEVSDAAARLRTEYGDALTGGDLRALDHLVDTMRPI